MKKLLLILEELNPPGVDISFPHFRYATGSGGAKYNNGDDGTEHHRRLNSICPDDRLQATLKCKITYFIITDYLEFYCK